jgi:hypothetical protein
MRRGCLATLLVVAVAIAGGWWWLDANFTQDDPVRVRSAASDFEPWPGSVEVLDARTVMGGPSVSIETAPDVERLYVLIGPSAAELGDAIPVVAQHLQALGWAMTVREGEASRGRWFGYSGTGPNGERAYVGALVAYLDSGLWVAEDGDAGPELEDAAGDRLATAVVLQVFAAG